VWRNYKRNKRKAKKIGKSRRYHKTIFQPSATYSLNLLIKWIDYTNIKNVYIEFTKLNKVLKKLNNSLNKNKPGV
jgi:hypothetical protein